MLRTMCAAGVVSLSLSTAAQAGVLFAFEETPEGVVGPLGGFLDITNAQPGGIDFARGGAIVPREGFLFSIDDNVETVQAVDSYLFDGPVSFGAGDAAFATDRSGDVFAVTTDEGGSRFCSRSGKLAPTCPAR